MDTLNIKFWRLKMNLDKKYRCTHDGRLKGSIFIPEDNIRIVLDEECLATLATAGNPAAMNAMFLERYTIHDAPFIYGKIEGLGYIIAEKDLEKI